MRRLGWVVRTIERLANSYRRRHAPMAGRGGLSSPRLRRGALDNFAKMLVGVNAGAMAVAPVDADGVIADRFHGQHFQRGLEHLKRAGRLGLSALLWAGRRAVRAGAGRTGTFVA